MKYRKRRFWDTEKDEWAYHRFGGDIAIGIIDKNQEDMFEGDIVLCKALSSETRVVIEDIRDVPAPILWKAVYKDKASLEIIGNRCQNPELYEEVKKEMNNKLKKPKAKRQTASQIQEM
jgi:hypothetical protein